MLKQNSENAMFDACSISTPLYLHPHHFHILQFTWIKPLFPLFHLLSFSYELFLPIIEPYKLFLLNKISGQINYSTQNKWMFARCRHGHDYTAISLAVSIVMDVQTPSVPLQRPLAFQVIH